MKVPQSLEKMNQSKQNTEFVNQQVTLLKEKELIANGRQNAESRNNSKDLRMRNGIILFTTLTCFLNFFRIIGHVHYSGSKRMLERHFGFTTTETGFLQSVDNIIGIVGYLIGGYLGDKVHKARLIAVCSLISSLSILSTSLPYFLTSGLNDHHMDYTFVNSSNGTPTHADVLCKANSSLAHTCADTSPETHFKSNIKAFNIFAVSRFLLGIGGIQNNIAIAYVTENTDPAAASVYIGKFLNFQSFSRASPTIAPTAIYRCISLPLHLLQIHQFIIREPRPILNRFSNLSM